MQQRAIQVPSLCKPLSGGVISPDSGLFHLGPGPRLPRQEKADVSQFRLLQAGICAILVISGTNDSL
jgi:hypothetical protein